MNSSQHALAQIPPARASEDEYLETAWTTDNGLPQNSVYAIQQTRDGYLWFTTLDGLMRFDGVKFTVFNRSNSKKLLTNRFTNLFAEADGTLWIGTEDGGLVRRRNGEFQTFTVADGLLSNRVQSVQKDVDGSLLITAHSGLARLMPDGRVMIERRGDFREYKIYVAASGARWELDKDGLRKFKDGQTMKYDLPIDANRISFNRTYNYFSFVQMLEDGNGTLWLTAAGTLFKIQNGALTIFTEADGMPNSLVKSITEDRAGNNWLGTEKDGACRFAGNRFNCYKTGDGLSSNYIMSMFVDREGTLWLGTNEGGINRLTPQVVSPLSTADGLINKNVYPLLQIGAEDVWIGSFTALSHYKNGEITTYTRREGLFYEIVQALYKDDDGTLWIGSVGGVETFADGKFTDVTARLNLGIGEAEFWDIHRDHTGTLWFATNIGLIKLEHGTVTRFTTADGLPGNDVKIIHEARDGSLWIGTYGGLAHFKSDAPTQMTIYSEGQGLTGNRIRAIYEDADDNLWIGTYESGLSRISTNGKITNYTTADGLFSNGVFAILEDARGNFWMSSNQGIHRVNREQLNAFADGKTSTVTSTVFGKSDGMLNTECNGGRQPAGIKTMNGKLWFPTQDGVAIIDPEAVPFNPNPPPVVIESVKIDNIVVSEPSLVADGFSKSQNSAAANGASKFTITPNQNNLEIAYTGLSFIKSEQVRFRYKLDGLDADWTEAGARRAAYFPYLPPGKYTFRVIAANSDNVWNNEGAAIEIVVLPPFYRTWWFVALTIFSLMMIGLVLYKRRVSELKRKQLAQENFSRRLINAHESERRRIAAELHDSLGQSLAMIKNSAVFAAHTASDLDSAKEQLNQITQQSAHAIGEVREIAYNLRPYLLDRLGLTKTITSMLNKVADTSRITLIAEVDEVDELFSDEAEMSIYRIIQESLSNILKHADATHVTVAVKKSDGAVAITIQDDGKGFVVFAPDDGERRGFGLLGISERVRMLGGTHAVQSAPGEGTTIIINLDFTVTSNARREKQ